MNSNKNLDNKAFSIEDEGNTESDTQSKIRKIKTRKLSTKNSSESLISENINGQLRNLHRKFSERTESMKSQIIRPISQDNDEGGDQEKLKTEIDENADAETKQCDADKPNVQPTQPDSTEKAITIVEESANKVICCCFKWKKVKNIFSSTFDSRNRFYLIWLIVGFASVVYNFFAIPLRECFDIYGYPYEYYWFIFDCISDVIYVADIVLFQHRLQYLNNGIIETNHKLCAINYVKGIKFKLDILSIIPTDLFSLISKKHRAALRFTRLFKFQTFFELFDVLDHVVKSGHIVRFVKTMSYIVYLIHFEACGYYLFSKFIGFSSDTFVFTPAPEQYSAYIYCFYWAMKTATSIGNNPSPIIYAEYCFMNIYWLSGIFVFAVLIGQIRDIFDAANANQTNYRKQMDTTILYMKNLNLSETMIKKVITWFDYNWEHHKTLDENSLIDSLPIKLKSDLAIHTHFNTLSKVSLFQDCERTLLSDLILKLKPVLFLPNDFICKKGEIGTEMYIVMTGQVEVVGGPNNSIVFATLKEGSVFGEISLLALSGGNRRTADVRSKGFSTLFSLSKQAFEEAMADYPAAYELLKDKANKVLNRHKVIEKTAKVEPAPEVIIPNKKVIPDFRHTVLKILENKRKSSLAKDNESYCSTPSEISLHYRDSISVTYDTKTPSPTFDRRFDYDYDNFQPILVHTTGSPSMNNSSFHPIKTVLKKQSTINSYENEIGDDEL